MARKAKPKPNPELLLVPATTGALSDWDVAARKGDIRDTLIRIRRKLNQRGLLPSDAKTARAAYLASDFAGE